MLEEMLASRHTLHQIIINDNIFFIVFKRYIGLCYFQRCGQSDNVNKLVGTEYISGNVAADEEIAVACPDLVASFDLYELYTC